MKDVVGRKGFGIGSAGLPAYNLLIEGPSQALENDVMLSMKQGNVAAPSRVVKDEKISGYFKHHGHRTAVSQRALQAHADPWVGWTELNGTGQVVQEISPYTADVDWDGVTDVDEILPLLRYLGQATAKVHCVSDAGSDQELVDFQTEDVIAEVVGDRDDEFAGDLATVRRGVRRDGPRGPSPLRGRLSQRQDPRPPRGLMAWKDRLKALDGQPNLIKAAQFLRQRLPGDKQLGDPLSMSGTVVGQRLNEVAAERPSTLREVGLSAFQVWQSVSEAQGRGHGHSEKTILFTDLVEFSDWALDVGDTQSLDLLRKVGQAAEPPIKDCDGEIVKRLGDGLMAVFDDPAAGGRGRAEVHRCDREGQGGRLLTPDAGRACTWARRASSAATTSAST